jgi:Spy/CpxP family protein refolding chaperone
MEFKKPEATDEMIRQLWFIIYGANGDGMYGQMRRLRRMFHRYMTKERFDTCPYTQYVQNRTQIDQTKKRSRGEWLKYVMSEILRTLTAIGLFTFIGKSVGFL